MSLFDGEPEGPKGPLRTAPLAERMRPRSLDEFSGQEHLVGPGKPLRVQIERDDSGSMILWGPPGVGKTTLAKIIAETTKASFIEFSAVMSGIKEIKQVMAAAAQASQMHSRTILFVDEIHRFNKAQQDAFLPYVERGTIRLIGATTENPFLRDHLRAALPLPRLCAGAAQRGADHALLRRALEDRERGLGALGADRRRRCAGTDRELLQRRLPQRLQHARSRRATGAGTGCKKSRIIGGRRFNDPACQQNDGGFSPDAKPGTSTRHMADRREAVQQRVLMYDKSGEEHYNLISALHKSVRNSDPDAALYWLARMFAAGEDPLYLARRVVRMAVEDIGLAAPEALNLTLSAKEAIDFLGSPEGDLALAEAVVYLCARAQVELGLHGLRRRAAAEIEQTRQEPVPLHLRNAPTRLMKELDYGKGYRYAHNEEGRVADMDCLPDSLAAAATTTPPRRAAKNSSPSAWKRFAASWATSRRRNW
jgi:putative ATPase